MEVINELEMLKQQQNVVNNKFDLRKKQFQLLIHSIGELNRDLLP